MTNTTLALLTLEAAIEEIERWAEEHSCCAEPAEQIAQPFDSCDDAWVRFEKGLEGVPCHPSTAFRSGWFLRAQPPTAQPLDEREAFEVWFMQEISGCNGEFVAKDDAGIYLETLTQRAWRGWQARAALASTVSEKAKPPLTAQQAWRIGMADMRQLDTHCTDHVWSSNRDSDDGDSYCGKCGQRQ